jgi:hypothetical protein
MTTIIRPFRSGCQLQDRAPKAPLGTLRFRQSDDHKPVTLPPDLTHEIENELRSARAGVTADRVRVIALEELHALALFFTATHGYPPTVADFLNGAPTGPERERRLRLLKLLR